jgi:hypothetical protein
VCIGTANTRWKYGGLFLHPINDLVSFGPFNCQKSPQKRSKNENVIFRGEMAFFIFSGENSLLKYPKLTGITSKITYPTLHLGEKVRCRLAFLAIFGPFRGHSSTKISPNGPKSPPNISYGWTLMVFAQKIKIQDPWLKNVVLGWNGPCAI